MDNNYIIECKEKLMKIILNLFKQKNYSKDDYFDFNVWFLKNYFRKFNNSTSVDAKDYFKDIINSSSNSSFDITKNILFSLFIDSVKNQNEEDIQKGKINVNLFITIFCDEFNTLIEQKFKIEKLVLLYNIFENKIKIEKNISILEKYIEDNKEIFTQNNNEKINDNNINLIFKKNYLKTKIKKNKSWEIGSSFVEAMVSNVNGLENGKYILSLFVSTINDNSGKEEILEFKLKNLIISNSDNKKELNVDDYKFSPFKLFCKDNTSYDEGFNIKHFQIKLENLAYPSKEYIASDTFQFTELLLSNINCLTDNLDPIKILKANVKLVSIDYFCNIDFLFKIKFDPFTLISVYKKILFLMNDLIEQKVIIDSKINYFYKYFPEIKYDIDNFFKPNDIDITKNNKENDDKGCIIT